MLQPTAKALPALSAVQVSGYSSMLISAVIAGLESIKRICVLMQSGSHGLVPRKHSEIPRTGYFALTSCAHAVAHVSVLLLALTDADATPE